MDVVEKAIRNVTGGLSYPKDRYEVLVVSDDGPETFSKIKSLVDKYAELYGIKMAAVNRTRPVGGYKGGAINYGVKLARGGELIMVLDADTEVPSDYLEHAVSYIEAGGYDMVGGAVYRGGRPAIPSATSKAIKVVYDVFNEIIILGGRFLSRRNWGGSPWSWGGQTSW